MANRKFHDIQGLNIGQKVLVGSFTPHTGSSTTGALNISGSHGISSISRVATGSFRLAVEDKYRGILAAHVQFQSGTVRPATGYVGGDVQAYQGLSDVNMTGSNYVDIYLCNTSGSNVLQPGRLVDVVGSARDRVHFIIFTSNSSLTK